MSDEDDSELSIPIQIGQRRLSTRPPAINYNSQRRGNRRVPAGIGGDVVKSMKQGIKTHSSDETKREARIRLLCTSSFHCLQPKTRTKADDKHRHIRWRIVLRLDGHLDSPTLWPLERMAAIMTSISHIAGSESSRTIVHLHQRYTIWLEISHHAQTLTGRSTRTIFAHHLPSQWKRSRLDVHYGNWTSNLLARLPRASTRISVKLSRSDHPYEVQ